MIKSALKPNILKSFVELPKQQVKLNEEMLNEMIDTINKAITDNIDDLSQNKYVLTKIKAIHPEAIWAMDLFKKEGWIIGYTYDEPTKILDVSIKKLTELDRYIFRYIPTTLL
jgi:hypothetical protein